MATTKTRYPPVSAGIAIFNTPGIADSAGIAVV